MEAAFIEWGSDDLNQGNVLEVLAALGPLRSFIETLIAGVSTARRTTNTSTTRMSNRMPGYILDTLQPRLPALREIADNTGYTQNQNGNQACFRNRNDACRWLWGLLCFYVHTGTDGPADTQYEILARSTAVDYLSNLCRDLAETVIQQYPAGNLPQIIHNMTAYETPAPVQRAIPVAPNASNFAPLFTDQVGSDARGEMEITLPFSIPHSLIQNAGSDEVNRMTRETPEIFIAYNDAFFG